MTSRYSALTACLFMAALALLSASCGSGGSGESQADRPIPGVEAVQARHGALPLTQRLSGVVKATNQVTISAEITGVVTEVLVKNGDTVEKGQPMVRLRDKEFRDRLAQVTASHQIAVAQARQAEARLKEIRSELKRIQALAEEKMVSASQLETAETRAVSAEADLDLANARVNQTLANMGEEQENLSRTWEIETPKSGCS
jgi:multidrug efflux pump subunit AcrA (membrane-fusion protein)